MKTELEGLETIAGGILVKPVNELLTLAHATIDGAHGHGEKKLVAPPIPGPPIGPFRHLFRRAFGGTVPMRPLKVASSHST
jgi:hypothetical protein